MRAQADWLRRSRRTEVTRAPSRTADKASERPAIRAPPAASRCLGAAGWPAYRPSATPSSARRGSARHIFLRRRSGHPGGRRRRRRPRRRSSRWTRPGHAEASVRLAAVTADGGMVGRTRTTRSRTTPSQRGRRQRPEAASRGRRPAASAGVSAANEARNNGNATCP